MTKKSIQPAKPVEIDSVTRNFAENALRAVEAAESLIAVAALALRRQDVDCDANIADTLDNHAWTEIDAARKHLQGLLGGAS